MMIKTLLTILSIIMVPAILYLLVQSFLIRSRVLKKIQQHRLLCSNIAADVSKEVVRQVVEQLKSEDWSEQKLIPSDRLEKKMPQLIKDSLTEHEGYSKSQQELGASNPILTFLIVAKKWYNKMEKEERIREQTPIYNSKKLKTEWITI